MDKHPIGADAPLLPDVVPEFAHDMGVIIVFAFREDFKDKFCRLLTGSPFRSMNEVSGGSEATQMKFSVPFYLDNPVAYAETTKMGDSTSVINRRISCIQLLSMTEFGGVNTHPLVSVDIYASLCALMAVLNMRAQPVLGVLFLGDSSRISGTVGPLLEKLARHVIGVARAQFQFVTVSWFLKTPVGKAADTLQKNELQIQSWLSSLFSPDDTTSHSAHRCRFARLLKNPRSAIGIVMSFLANLDILSDGSIPLLQAEIPNKGGLFQMSMGPEYEEKIKREMKALETNIRKEMKSNSMPDNILAEFLDEGFQLLVPYLQLHNFGNIRPSHDRESEWTNLASALSELVKERRFILLFDDAELLGPSLNQGARLPLVASEVSGTYFLVSPEFRNTADDTSVMMHSVLCMAFMGLFKLSFGGLVYHIPDGSGTPSDTVLNYLFSICGDEKDTRTKHLVIARSAWPEKDSKGVLACLPDAHLLSTDGQSRVALQSRIIDHLTAQLAPGSSLISSGHEMKAYKDLCEVETPVSDTSAGQQITEFLVQELAVQENRFRASRRNVSNADPASLLAVWERQIAILLLQWRLIRFTGSNHMYKEIAQELENSGQVEMNITRLEAIVSVQSNINPEKGHKVAQLGDMYIAHFDLHGGARTLEQAIDEYNKAVALIPEDDPRRADLLMLQAAALEKKFQLFGAKDDIVRGIMKCKEAAAWHYRKDTSTNANLKKAFAQHAVGAMLKRKFEAYFDEPQDIEEAIRCFHEAKRFTPYGHQASAIIFADICHSHVLKSKYSSLKNDITAAVSDIEEAMDQYNKTLPEPGPTHPGYAMILNAKCVAYAKHHKLVSVKGNKSKHSPDIHEAIRAGELAVAHVQGKSQECAYLVNLGKALWYAHEEAKQKQQATEDMTKAIECFRHGATQCETADKMPRFKAARLWAKLEAEKQSLHSKSKQDFKETLKAYEYCIILLAEVASQEVPIHEQYRRLERIQRVVYQATALAVTYGRLDKAVEFFEEGRSVIWRHYFKHDVLMHALQEKHPDLAKEYSQFLTQLKSQAADADNSRTYINQTVEEVSASQAPSSNWILSGYRKVRKAITNLVDFSFFSFYKKLNILDTAAENGPIVIVNLYEDQCDALIIQKGKSVTHVGLESMTTAKANALQTDLRLKVLGENIDSSRGMGDSKNYVGQGKERPQNDPLAGILAQLWGTVASPIAKTLGKSVSKGSRVFWCLAGPLAFLPIHAAGDYVSKEKNSKLSDTIHSSYIPNIFSLLRKATPSKDAFRVLAVAQSVTPNENPLPKTIPEVEYIGTHELVKKYAKVLIDKEGTVQQVKKELVTSQWAHFACHGVQDKVDGLKSALLLDQGKKLALKDLVELKIPSAELAFLSACQSAKGDITLPEEHIHLAAGMLVVGYQGVIATMWSIHDDDGLYVARNVYDKLFALAQTRGSSLGSKVWSLGGLIGSDKGKPDFKEAAGVLHDVVAELRKDPKVEFKRWVPFVHIGL